MKPPSINRREFARAAGAAALAGSVVSPAGAQAGSRSSFSLSVMLWTVWRDLPFAERLAHVAEAGYRNVELVGEYAHWTGDEFRDASNAARQHGIRFDATAGLHNGVANPAVREAFLAEFKAALDPMTRLLCPAMIVLSGNIEEGMTAEQQHASSIEGLKRAASLIEGRQIDGQPVRILLECIDQEENPRYFLKSAAEAIEIVRAVNHPQVQFLYDLFHEQIAEGNLMEKLEKHIDIIGLIHVADVPGRHEPGSGEINYRNIFRKLVELKYDRMVAMEFRPSGDTLSALRAARMLAETP